MDGQPGLGLAAAALAAVATLAIVAAGTGAQVGGIDLVEVADGFDRPLLLTHAEDGSGRRFVVTQPGLVWSLDDGQQSLYLDVRDKVSCCGEQGLLGLAFDPGFKDNGRLYVSYTRGDGANVLRRYTVADPAGGGPDPDGGEVILTQDQPFGNHNAGHLAFGPDGFLHMTIGDGGGAGDPLENAQDTSNLLGAMLRLDVDVADGYDVPDDNPFVGQAGRDEIWAYGLRNPWRFSFDRQTGDLWIGDVGQNRIEEIDFQAAGTPGGQNYGWDAWEGRQPFEVQEALSPESATMTYPADQYSHELGCSVTGGHVYRGPAAPALQGRYVYGDFCSGRIWATTGSGPVVASQQILDTDLFITSFGEDEAGNVYVVDRAGAIYRIVAA